MNKRNKVLGYAVIAFAALLAAVVIFAKETPAECNLDKVKDKLPAVKFNHKKHVEEIKVECAACHHKNPEEPASCFSCHKKEKEGDAEKAKDAFHKLCVTCHKEKKSEDKNPPIKCMECHKKEEPKP